MKEFRNLTVRHFKSSNVLAWGSLLVTEFVCPRSYLRNYTSDLHQIFCACYLWPWLGPPLAA